MEMVDEGRNRDVRTNVLRTSKRGPNADVSGRPQNVRQRTSKRGPNVDVLKTTASERQKEDQMRTSSERPPVNVTMRTYCGPKRTFGTFGGRPLFAGGVLQDRFGKPWPIINTKMYFIYSTENTVTNKRNKLNYYHPYLF